MAVEFRKLLKRLGRLEKTLLVLLVLALAARYGLPGGSLELLTAFAVFVTAVLVAFRWLIIGMRKVIWRLRYRLLVVYLFIAVVPILLILILVSAAAYVLTGQIAAYLVTTELERRTSSLFEPARSLAWAPPEARNARARWIAPSFWERFPGFEILIESDNTWRYPDNAAITAPPPGWDDRNGLVLKGGQLYLWAHAIHDSTEVTMMAPVSQETLSSLVPDLGGLTLMPRRSELVEGSSERRGRLVASPRDFPSGTASVPPAANALDVQVAYAAPVPVALWEAPGKVENQALLLRTRPSAVLSTVFGQKVEWASGMTMRSMAVMLFTIVAGVLLAVELASVVIGIRLTRTITRAVHSLYEGTQRVREGDFSHRIGVRGNDQLAELGESFNRMTENLERLVEVAKEKERLQSEIEIAREVQNQLFPRSLPVSRTLAMAATCRPARLVSGDYYDYLNLRDDLLAIAIGDVAGKGISAALLMATVQSTMRMQLRACRELAAAAGDGNPASLVSTATLVSRLNQQLFAYTPPEKFATFFFALYDDVSGLLTYTNAGHLPPILVRDGAATRLEVNGTVVGAFAFSEYGESCLQLNAGDLLVCFTDGVTEPENEFGEMFSEERLTDIILRHHRSESEEIVAAVAEAVRHWTGSPELQDDMTLLLARRV